MVTVTASPHIIRPVAHFALWQGFLLLAALALPLLLAHHQGIREAWWWVLLVAPVAVLSLGESLTLPPADRALPMPLELLRRLPLLHRITFSFRFNAPLLVGLAAAWATLWRASGGQVQERTSGHLPLPRIQILAALWLTAAFAPPAPLGPCPDDGMMVSAETPQWRYRAPFSAVQAWPRAYQPEGELGEKAGELQQLPSREQLTGAGVDLVVKLSPLLAGDTLTSEDGVPGGWSVGRLWPPAIDVGQAPRPADCHAGLDLERHYGPPLCVDETMAVWSLRLGAAGSLDAPP